MRRNGFDRESLCLFFGAERVCDSVSSKAPTCLRCVKHHFRGSMLVFEAGHIYFFYKQNEIEGEICCSKQPNRLSMIVVYLKAEALNRVKCFCLKVMLSFYFIW